MKFSEMPYKRPDMEEIRKFYTDLCEKFKNAKSGEEQYKLHLEKQDFDIELMSNSQIAMIRHDGNNKDEFYNAESDYFDSVMPEFEAYAMKYQELLYASPYRDFLEQRLGPVAFKAMELKKKSFDEKLIPLMQEENKLCSEYKKLLATAEVEWEGEKLNFSLMKKPQTSPDRETRKRAHQASEKTLLGMREDLDRYYDLLVKNRDKQAKMMGFENYVEMGYCRMNRHSYTRKEIEKFREQVKRDFVPFAERLHDERRKRLGLDKLRYYDSGVNFLNGNPAPTGTPEEILESGRKMYNELSPETGEFMNFMCDNELFDVLGRKNKRTGGYMTHIPKYKSPFIFANFNGTAGDVDVITHECGHAFQGFIMRDFELLEHTDITMDTAEIHSMSMEFFTEPWMKNFFGERSDEYLRMHLEEACCFIPYGCMVDEFQHIVYDNPDMTPAERNAAWLKLEKEYRPHADYEGNEFFSEGRIWQRQHHIYTMPFYYIDYVLSQTCALEFKAMMDEDYKGAWEKYMKLCRLGAREFYEPMLEKVGLVSPFKDGTLKMIAEKIESKL